MVSLREKAKKQLRVQSALALAAQRGEPEWIDVNTEKLEGHVFKSAHRTAWTCLQRDQ